MKALKSNSTKMNEKENLRNLRDKERKKMHKNQVLECITTKETIIKDRSQIMIFKIKVEVILIKMS